MYLDFFDGSRCLLTHKWRFCTYLEGIIMEHFFEGIATFKTRSQNGSQVLMNKHMVFMLFSFLIRQYMTMKLLLVL